ncbi:DUF3866 family protein [Desmospora activa]|uniref:Uncharacterized protein DUF3866 n=1 Tax=Desmospora activa DSM 45169 TaxID=1121389 RepID=A0A2T4Z9M8_9BACL|nr:DUF3866 family protein [Desmospora activa]PTM58587.1 uncharacterized protein DUF3866 [Desmospora activa DSM 45169]
MIIWKKGTVLRVLEESAMFQRVRVKMEAGEEASAVHYPLLLGQTEPGDEVWLNTTAVELQLGTGGDHFVAGWVSKRPESSSPQGHIMKMRYTPWQIAVSTGEEVGNPYRSAVMGRNSLDSWPILLGELHSMLPAVISVWRHRSLQEGRCPRIVYIMTDGGALPLAMSQHVRRLKKLGWLYATVTVGHAFGGDVEAVNLHSALLLARYGLKADLVFVSMGPGIVGTDTPFGFSGVEQGEAVNAVAALEGMPIFIPRIQGEDGRKRHQGVSHHTLTNLTRVVLTPAEVPVPRPLPVRVQTQMESIPQHHHLISVPITEKEVVEFLKIYPVSIQSMGRKVAEDPLFFRTICAGALHLWKRWLNLTDGRSGVKASGEKSDLTR